MPKISVVIPVYNVEDYLEECIDSVLNQTFKDYELILVDDGSIDKSGEICDDYANKYDCITVIHQDNRGQGSARNAGVNAASSEWIAFIDSDDVAHPQMLEYLWKAREESGSKISACNRFEGKSIPNSFSDSIELNYDKIIIDEKSLKELYTSGSDLCWALIPALVYKDVYNKHRMHQGKIYEDNAVCCRWLYEAKVVSYINSDMYFYRINPNSTMNKPFTLKRLDYLWALNEQIKFYNEIKYYDMLNCIVKEYIGATKYSCDEIDKNLNDRRVIKKVLRKTLKNCKKYKDHINNYNQATVILRKMLHPFYYRIKKRLF